MYSTITRCCYLFGTKQAFDAKPKGNNKLLGIGVDLLKLELAKLPKILFSRLMNNSSAFTLMSDYLALVALRKAEQNEYSLMNFTFFDDFGCFARTFVDGFPARPPTERKVIERIFERFSRVAHMRQRVDRKNF